MNKYTVYLTSFVVVLLFFVAGVANAALPPVPTVTSDKVLIDGSPYKSTGGVIKITDKGDGTYIVNNGTYSGTAIFPYTVADFKLTPIDEKLSILSTVITDFEHEYNLNSSGTTDLIFLNKTVSANKIEVKDNGHVISAVLSGDIKFYAGSEDGDAENTSWTNNGTVNFGVKNDVEMYDVFHAYLHSGSISGTSTNASWSNSGTVTVDNAEGVVYLHSGSFLGESTNASWTNNGVININAPSVVIGAAGEVASYNRGIIAVSGTATQLGLIGDSSKFINTGQIYLAKDTKFGYFYGDGDFEIVGDFFAIKNSVCFKRDESITDMILPSDTISGDFYYRAVSDLKNGKEINNWLTIGQGKVFIEDDSGDTNYEGKVYGEVSAGTGTLDSNDSKQEFINTDGTQTAVYIPTYSPDLYLPDSGNLNSSIYSIRGYSNNTEGDVPLVDTTIVLTKEGLGTLTLTGDHSWYNGVFNLGHQGANSSGNVLVVKEESSLFGGDVNLYEGTKLIWEGGMKDEYNKPNITMTNATLDFELVNQGGTDKVFSFYGTIKGDTESIVNFRQGTVFINGDASGFSGNINVLDGTSFVVRKKDNVYEGKMFGGILTVLDENGVADKSKSITIFSNSGLNPLTVASGVVFFLHDQDTASNPIMNSTSITGLTVGVDGTAFVAYEGTLFTDTTVHGRLELSGGTKVSFDNLDLDGGTLKIAGSNLATISMSGNIKVGSSIEMWKNNAIETIDMSSTTLNIYDSRNLDLYIDLDVAAGTADNIISQNVNFTDGSSIVIQDFNILNNPTTEYSHLFQVLTLTDPNATYIPIAVGTVAHAKEVDGRYGIYKLFSEGGDGYITLRLTAFLDDICDQLVTDLMGNRNDRAVAKAWTTPSFTDGTLQGDINIAIVEGLINQTPETIDILSALAPETAPLYQTISTQIINQIYDTVDNRLISDKNRAVWAKALFNTTTVKPYGLSRGFDSKVTGISVGLENISSLGNTSGLSYSFTNSDTDGMGRKTEVDNHTFALYADVNSSKFKLSGITSYTFGGYDDSKKFLYGQIDNTEYDVRTFAAQGKVGYDLKSKNTTITSELGLRYMNIARDSYSDAALQNIHGEQFDIFTAIAGLKVTKDITLNSGVTLHPSAKIGVTYDMITDGTKTTVDTPNSLNSTYTVYGEPLKKLGAEVVLGIGVGFTNNLGIMLDYRGDFRDSYSSHGGQLNFIYNF